MGGRIMLKVAASVALIVSLAACSGPPKPGTPEYALQQHEFQAEKTKTAADQAPDWYINPPKTEGYIYAAGTATSSDLQFAVDKAILNAKYQLADQMNGKVSGKQKSFISENASGEASGTAERATSNIVADIALPAYQVMQRKVVPVDTQFRSYVLLQFAVARGEVPQQTASIIPTPSPAALQKQAEAAQRELQSDVVSAKEESKPVVAFPIGLAPAAQTPAQTAEVPPPGSAPSEPPAPEAAPRPAVDGEKL
jgi:hypothetical protein